MSADTLVFSPTNGASRSAFHHPEREPLTLFVFPQAQLELARHDFLVAFFTTGADDIDTADAQVVLVVECDGHDYHERTKDQARRERSRDRSLQALGRSIFRFTGAEIWADHHACADEAITHLLSRAAAGGRA